MYFTQKNNTKNKTQQQDPTAMQKTDNIVIQPTSLTIKGNISEKQKLFLSQYKKLKKLTIKKASGVVYIPSHIYTLHLFVADNQEKLKIVVKDNSVLGELKVTGHYGKRTTTNIEFVGLEKAIWLHSLELEYLEGFFAVPDSVRKLNVITIDKTDTELTFSQDSHVQRFKIHSEGRVKSQESTLRLNGFKDLINLNHFTLLAVIQNCVELPDCCNTVETSDWVLFPEFVTQIHGNSVVRELTCEVLNKVIVGKNLNLLVGVDFCHIVVRKSETKFKVKESKDISILDY